MKNNLLNIRRVSRNFRSIFYVLIFCLPFLNILYWQLFNLMPKELFTLPVVIAHELTFSTRMLAMFASFIPVTVAVLGLLAMARLFSLYEKGIIFSADNVKQFRILGYLVLGFVFAKMLHTTILSFILTYQNLPGKRILVAQFDIMDLLAILVGAFILIVAWVMDEGRKLKDEHTYTI